jgi:hypothetical protein
MRLSWKLPNYSEFLIHHEYFSSQKLNISVKTIFGEAKDPELIEGTLDAST